MKRKNYKRLQKAIQDLYMMTFFSWSFVLMFVAKFSKFKDIKILVIVVVITGSLTIGKGITHYRKNPKKVRKEIYEMLKSENGIKF